VDDLRNDDPFSVTPETNEYDALSFLVSDQEYGFTPADLADRTYTSHASASKTMTRLFDNGIVERSQGMYYVDPDRADSLKHRLTSIDAAIRVLSPRSVVTHPDLGLAKTDMVLGGII